MPLLMQTLQPAFTACVGAAISRAGRSLPARENSNESHFKTQVPQGFSSQDNKIINDIIYLPWLLGGGAVPPPRTVSVIYW